ncbi:hypothetical protein [Campylobacter troglodytis]|uniref:hypothetical protein n=1 Tax=Campylobacter troglodytis TaxID=654363 RepID=UPI00163BF7F3|nr:hypothetical protein [Campylobacter troglodytis]
MTPPPAPITRGGEFYISFLLPLRRRGFASQNLQPVGWGGYYKLQTTNYRTLTLF